MNNGDKRPIGEILVETQACSPEDVARALAEQHDLRFYDLDTIDIPKQVIELVPEQLAKEKIVVPVSLNGRTLTVAMSNPLDLEIVDSLRFQTSLAIEVAVASERQIKAALEKVWGVSEATLDKMLGELTEDIQYRKTEEGEEKGDDALIIKFVQQIIANALNARASDIHIEPAEKDLRVATVAALAEVGHGPLALGPGQVVLDAVEHLVDGVDAVAAAHQVEPDGAHLGGADALTEQVAPEGTERRDPQREPKIATAEQWTQRLGDRVEAQ